MSSLTLSQQKTLALLPHITGSLSLIGSASILYDIFKDRQHKMREPYYRILLGMSLCDALVSMSLCLSTLPIPEGTPGVYNARGTTETCTASGFFNQFMLGSILYNLVLSVYYTLSGTYKMSDEEFAKKYEPWLHGVAVVLTVSVAFAGIPLTIYNSAQLWCWISPYPPGCETYSGVHNPDLACERGYEAWIYRWLFFYGPLWFTIICVTILMIMLTLSVMKEERDVIHMGNSSVDDGGGFVDEQGLDSSNNGNIGSSNGNVSCASNNDINNNNSDQANNEDVSVTNSNSEINDRPNLPKSESVRLERTRKMFYQALLYVGIFYLTWIIPTINRFLQLLNKPTPYSVLVLTAFLAPIQGFFNWLVYRHGPCVA